VFKCHCGLIICIECKKDTKISKLYHSCIYYDMSPIYDDIIDEIKCDGCDQL